MLTGSKRIIEDIWAEMNYKPSFRSLYSATTQGGNATITRKGIGEMHVQTDQEDLLQDPVPDVNIISG